MKLLFVCLMCLAIIVEGQLGGRNICRHGTAGSCLGYTNQQCPRNSVCRRVSGTYGVCCRLPNSNPGGVCCRHGQRGSCGGLFGLRCPRGTTCQCFPNPPYPDAAGTCCISRPGNGY
ncbi:hypothetical protein MAR_034073 [Mya arenaria]|uniref:Uncharacterized protein n=1 Tax=Mya arenaria TaxID=6604 RepID=A0ABY7GF15_MYAAR|nr:uncharacterized protein LOC128224520 [Mya arenaria]XP_052790600.1 uncharacterized protein LOC128224675 [Mya arenaria]WAR31531.1 hypothetical protein MAR_034073 [Mya arenaria]